MQIKKRKIKKTIPCHPIYLVLTFIITYKRQR